MNLFVIYIGGSHQDSLIELHDMRFVVAQSIEQTYESLRQSWWGTPASLHLDAWGILDYADGHQIELSKNAAAETSHQLYFVNLGGYDRNQFTELHKNIFVVAANEHEAKHKAVQQIADWESPHRDYLYQVEHFLNLNALLQNQGYYLHLTQQRDEKPFQFTCFYNHIGKIENGL
ncbi:MAG: DUF1543 domain-containing protein [Legionella sp.]